MNLPTHDAAWFVAVLDAMSELVLVKGADSRLLWANRAFREVYGLSNEELSGLIDAEHSDPDDTLQYVRDDRHVFTTGEPVRVDEPISDPEGAVSYFDTIKTPLRDSSGIIERTVGVSRALAGERAEESAESRSKYQGGMELFRAVIAATPTAMLVVDMIGRITFANARAGSLFGYSVERLVGMPVDDLVPLALREAHAQHQAEFWSAPRVRPMGNGLEIEGVRADGTMIPLEIALNPLQDLGAPAVLVSISDLTQRLAEERELRRVNVALRASNQHLEEFAYVASHDLKSPMRAISNLSQWLVEDISDQVNEEGERLSQLLVARVARMERLLDDLLLYSRVGSVEYQAEEIDTAALVAGLEDLLQVSPGFRIEVEGDLPRLASAQRTPLEQVLRNLVDNAIKHHDQEQGVVRVSCTQVGGLAEFCVADDGPGIPPEYRERVFRLFQTLKPRDEVEGSGMGLALIRRLVTRAGGDVRIEGNEERRGTRVIFSWPNRAPT